MYGAFLEALWSTGVIKCLSGVAFSTVQHRLGCVKQAFMSIYIYIYMHCAYSDLILHGCICILPTIYGMDEFQLIESYYSTIPGIYMTLVQVSRYLCRSSLGTWGSVHPGVGCHGRDSFYVDPSSKFQPPNATFAAQQHATE